jgi:catechol 2,3-dioxygenase-like lactoylglutathione lyase family enzyme
MKLPIESQITFLYTSDLTKTARFYEIIMGFSLKIDQGICRIYQVTETALVGFCERAKVPDDKSNVIFTIVTPDVDGWYEKLRDKGVEFEKPPEINPKFQIYHTFLRDPNGYLIEIQRFL